MSLLTAEFSDVIKGLVLLAFLLGPVLRKLVTGLNDPARRAGASRRPARPAAPAESPGRRARATWEELMRGAVPQAPEMPEVDQDPVPVAGAQSPDPPWSPLATSLDMEELGEIKDEEQFERLGVELGPTLDSIVAVGEPTQARELEETASDEWGVDTGITRARVLRSRMKRTGWRDGVLLGEILGSPLALREDWSHAGPPLGRRRNTQHG